MANDLPGDGIDMEYAAAIGLILLTGTCTVSMLQRRLRIGYNQALRHLETMEGAGIVSKSDACGRRRILANLPASAAEVR